MTKKNQSLKKKNLAFILIRIKNIRFWKLLRLRVEFSMTFVFAIADFIFLIKL